MSVLRAWRERQGYTRDELARLVGAANPISVYRWEQPEGSTQFRLPPIAVAKKLFRLSRGEVSLDSFIAWPDLGPELPLELPEPPPAAPLLDRLDAPELQHAA